MCYHEILVRATGSMSAFEVTSALTSLSGSTFSISGREFIVALVETVGDEFDRCLGHCLELLLHERRNSHDCCGIIQHLLFHPLMPSFSSTCH